MGWFGLAAREPVTRRGFLRRSGLVAVTAAAGLSCTTDDDDARRQGRAPAAPDVHCAGHFFRPHEAQTVEALSARILPGNPDDPGAREAGVVNYIDCLLAANGGFAEPVYLQPPFPAPEPEDLRDLQADYPDLPELVAGGEPGDPDLGSTADASAIADLRDDSVESTSFGVLPIPKNTFDRYGYQSLLAPAELYRRGIAALDEHTTATYGAPFADLGEADQDVVVAALADDELAEFDVPSAEGFFEMVRRHTIEGMFSDPIYGGNRDLVGWELLGYPGAQRAYTSSEVRDPRFAREPQSLADLHRFNSSHADRDEPVLPVAGSDRHHD